jgi:hypothetical protein
VLLLRDEGVGGGSISLAREREAAVVEVAMEERREEDGVGGGGLGCGTKRGGGREVVMMSRATAENFMT